MEGEVGVSRSIIDELDSSDTEGDRIEGESVILEVSLVNFILGISNEIKWKVKVVLFEVSLMNFILRRSNEIKWMAKVVLPEVSLRHFILWISNEIK